MQFIVKISIFLIHQIKSYSGINIENVPDGTQILKILRHVVFSIRTNDLKYFLLFKRPLFGISMA
jgi:hypothetical protein